MRVESAYFFGYLCILSLFQLSRCHLVKLNKDIEGNGSHYMPGKQSFLEYMVHLKLSSDGNISQLADECDMRIYAFTAYHAAVYISVCQDLSTAINTVFCENVLTNISYYKQLYLDEEFKEFWNISKSKDDPDMLFLACNAIISYHTYMKSLPANVGRRVKFKEKSNISSVSYTEILVEDFPFCHPFICPYFQFHQEDERSRMKSHARSIFDCMPVPCRAMYYMTIALDVLVTIAISLLNPIIIYIRCTNDVLSNSYG